MTKISTHRRKVGRPSAASRQGDTAEKLRTVALDLFAAHGYGQVTIKDIGVAAGVNTAMIYYYFENKESLCRAALKETASEVFVIFQQAIDKVDDPKEKIHCWLETHIEMMEPMRKMVKVSLDLKIDSSKGIGVDEAIGHFYELEKETLIEFINLGAKNGDFRIVDTDDIRRIISTFLDGAMIRSFIRPDFDLRRTVYAFREMLWRYLEVETSGSITKKQGK